MLLPSRYRIALGAALAAVGFGLLAIVPPAATAAAATSAPAAYDPHTLLVTFKVGTTDRARAAVHNGEDATVANRFSWSRTDVIRLPHGVDPLRIAAAYRHHPRVLAVEPNWIVRATDIPNDPRFAELWGLHNSGQNIGGVVGVSDVDVDAPEAWTGAFGAGSFPSSGGVRVGVVDTGIQSNHPDLVGKVAACARATSGIGAITVGSCADDNGHGTHVAGTIAAVANNGVGVAGVAPNASLAIFKALGGSGSGFYADIVAGIRWLRTTGQARIINMSLGGPLDFQLNTELAAAYGAGVLLVGAAGNTNNGIPIYPAGHLDVMSVGAVDSRGVKAAWSNCNADVEIAAPGVRVLSTYTNSSYATLSGTSMATPHVAGVAALVMAAKGTTAAQTRALLRANTQGSGSCNGSGVVNAARALGIVAPAASPSASPSVSPSASASPSASPSASVSPSASPSPSPSTVSPSPSPSTTSPSPSATTSPPAPPITGMGGIVRNNTGAPVNGAVIQCFGLTKTATTNAAGSYTLVAPAGSYTCYATAPMHFQGWVGARVIAGQQSIVNYTLTRF